MSFFSWMDHSERDRRQMLDLVQLFGEKDTRDELGVGSVRDGLADLLFPGINTIQTRARYFLIIAWIYSDLERRIQRNGQTRTPTAARARKQEVEVIRSLIDAGETVGVIGRRAKDKLRRLPSNIYWQGLYVLGIRQRPGAQDHYHRVLDRGTALAGPVLRDDDGLPLERRRDHWHPGLPPAPPGFPKLSSLNLSQVEAQYLQERIVSQVPGTYLAFLAAAGREQTAIGFPWEYPQALEAGPLIVEQLEHAHNFSQAIYGAVLLYNLLLAEEARMPELIDDYRQRLKAWATEFEVRDPALATWDRDRFWAVVRSGNPRIPGLTRLFVDQWLAVILTPWAVRGLADHGAARELIAQRERYLKRDLARLSNRRSLDLWRAAGAAGLLRLDFRWATVQQQLTDLYTGLGSPPGARQ